MFALASFFRSEKPEKISFQTLSEAQKQIIEAAYKVYSDASEGKTSCNLEEKTPSVLDPKTGQPLYVKLEELVKNGEEATADGWATFTAYIAKKDPHEEPDMEKTKKAFEKAYKLGAENKNAATANITEFANLPEIQQNAWLTSAQFIYNTGIALEATSTPTCPAP